MGYRTFLVFGTTKLRKILKYANPFAHFLKNETEICDLSRIRGLEAYPA